MPSNVADYYNIATLSGDSGDDNLDCITLCQKPWIFRKEQSPLAEEDRVEEEEQGQELEESRSDRRVVRTFKHEHGTSERVIMTDDEGDGTYGEWKRKIAEGKKRKPTDIAKFFETGGLEKKIRSEAEARKVSRNSQGMNYLISSELASSSLLPYLLELHRPLYIAVSLTSQNMRGEGNFWALLLIL